MYNLLVKNWSYMPKRGSTCCQTDWLVNVLHGKFWVPKYTEIVQRPCLSPPHKSLLFSYMQSEANKAALQLGFDEKHMPDKAWMITVIGTLNPQHFIFGKEYEPPHSVVNAGLLANLEAEVDPKLFEGLKPSKSKRGGIYKRLVNADKHKAVLKDKLLAQQQLILKQLQMIDDNAHASQSGFVTKRKFE